MPLTVALVATVLNEAQELDSWLRSIETQTHQPQEVIFADGGSADGTYERLLAWAADRPSVRVLRVPGANISMGRNAAIQTATSDVIAVTDAGVILEPTWLERLVERARPEVDVVAGFFLPRAEGRFERAMGATVLPTADEVDGASFLPSSRSVAFRRAVWEQAGGYPEWLDYCEDLVFDLALRREGAVTAWAPDAVVHFRPRGSLPAFFLQYYRYARGDGKADLWRMRHAVRYAAYAYAVGSLASRNPIALAGVLLGAAWYCHRPWRRLLAADQRGTLETVLMLALVPLIRFTGDLAKMLGYPVGVLWRLRRQAPPP
jgi:glycosyltransferase involved in cell wall biosynthesis